VFRGTNQQSRALPHLVAPYYTPSESNWEMLTGPIAVRAAAIYADLQQRGELISDADILMSGGLKRVGERLRFVNGE